MQANFSLPLMVRWVIWLAMTISVVVYFCLIHFVILKPSEAGGGGTVALPLLIAGVVIGLVGILMRLPALRLARVPGAEQKANALFFAALALSEAPGVFGFVLGLLGQGPKDYLPLFAISAFALLSNRPSAFFPRDDDE